jgi:hypothetical protein
MWVHEEPGIIYNVELWFVNWFLQRAAIFLNADFKFHSTFKIQNST